MTTVPGFGPWLEAMLRSRGFNRQSFGKLIGVDPSRVSRWCLGTDRPRPETCRKIADGLSLPVAEVLERAGHIEARAEIDATDPVRARLHVLVDQLDPEVLRPHLEILDRVSGLLGRN